MPAWLQRDWCSSFVLALGHFLWQGTLIAFVLAIALRATKTVSVRYWLSLAALLVMPCCVGGTLIWVWPENPGSGLQNSKLAAQVVDPTQTPKPPILNFEDLTPASRDVVIPDHPLVTQPLPSVPRSALPSEMPINDHWRQFAPWLTSGYFAGVALMLLRLVFGLWGGRRLRQRVHLIDDPSLLNAMQRQATALGLKLLPVLAYCERVTVPTVVGVLKPMILLPLTLTSGLSPEQMESVLAHELAHLRRCDHLVNLLQRVIESLLFFHPALWWVSHRIRDEREHCCDDLVVACGAMPLDYAKSLLVVAELSRASQLRAGRGSPDPARGSVAAVSLLATGPQKPSHLRQRIARLLGESATPALRISPRVLATSITVLLVGLATLIQLGMSNEQSPSKRDDDRESGPAIANLPDGIAVELVGLTEMSKDETNWWKPDGVVLTPTPTLAPQQRGTWKVGDIELRRVLIHVRGFKKDSMAVTANMSGSHVIEQLPSGESYLSYAGALQRPPAKRPTVVRVGIATEPLSPTRVLEANGQRRPRPADAPLDHIAEDIVVTKVRRLEGGKKEVAGKFVPIFETEVTYEMPAAWRQADLRIVAIDKTGQTHHTSGGGGNLRDDANSKSPGQAMGLAMFPLPPEEIDRFEYQFRLFRHWVTFENVSFQRGEKTHVKVAVDSLPDEKPKKYSAQLPNGVEVELAGVAMANVAYPDQSKRRKADAWWRADGTRLPTPPFELFSAWVDESQKDSREFAIRLTPARDATSITTNSVTWTPSPPRGSSGVASWDTSDGEPSFLKLQHTAGFKDEKPVTVHVFVSDQPFGPALLFDVNGKRLREGEAPAEPKPADAKTESLRKFIHVIGIEKSDNETIVRSKRLPAEVDQRLEINVRAIDQKDQPHSSSESRGTETGDGRVFKLAPADIKHFEIRLRPMTQKVTFENVSLVPGQVTDVKVKVESIDLLALSGLEFLKPYPKLHGLSLDMTEPQFLEIVKQQELKTRKTVEGEKVTHHIALGDGHTLIVMFDKDATCSGIQRVRGEDNSGAGRGSPDPAPTAGLPNSDEATNPPNNANGDTRQPAVKKDEPKPGAQLKPATEQMLRWGEPVNGLRMALAWPPTFDEPGMSEAQEFYLVVQNVTQAAVRLTANDAAPNPRNLTLFDATPVSRTVDDVPMPGDWLLQPREVAFVRLFHSQGKRDDGRTFSAVKEQIVRVQPQYRYMAEMSIPQAPAGAWTGKLVTGSTRGSADVIQPQSK